MQEQNQYYLGLMSGTSLDGVDIALVQIGQDNHVQLVDFTCLDLPLHLAEQLQQVSIAERVSTEQVGQLGIELAKLKAKACIDMLAANKLNNRDVVAIGSHGVTIRHRPELELPFTLQITDPNTLAALTGIDVIADFRGMDMAVSGQGAPLVPMFHRALFAETEEAILANLGGIANITVLSTEQDIVGYDTGPANTLMDVWYRKNQGPGFDCGGQWAKSGKVIDSLLKQMLALPYFSQSYPKSTGKETFNLAWLESLLAQQSTQYNPADVQSTLLMLTATTLADEISKFSPKLVYLCGGGGQNDYLVSVLRGLLAEHQILTTADAGVDPDALEAMAFAWLAYCRVHQIPANAPSVTGATRPVVLGAWYSAHREEWN